MSVSLETAEKLKIYHALLQKWQLKINLISNNTLENAWERHFEDSLQLLDILPEKPQILFDIGTGAGFPGLVLAISNSNYDVHLIESDQKKCSFLKNVSRETSTDVQIINKRIENIDLNDHKIPDIITARALASLSSLFEYCKKWIEQNPRIQLVFMKGERADEEIQELENSWKFESCTYQSKTSKSSKIIVFTDISRL